MPLGSTKKIPQLFTAARDAVNLFIREVTLKRSGRNAQHNHGRGGKAVATDPSIKTANLRRLKRIEGQIRGVHQMVEDERYCADILDQLAAIQSALRAVGHEVLRNHLRHCATAAIRQGEAEADAMYDELVNLMRKNCR